MELFYKLLEVLGLIFGLLVVPATIIGLYLHGEESRKEMLGWLRSKRGTTLYGARITRIMDAIDRELTPENVIDTPPPERWWHDYLWYLQPKIPTQAAATRDGKLSFGWPLLDFSMRLAIAYPILSMILMWGWTGDATLLGSWFVLPPELPEWLPSAVFYGMLAFVGLVALALYNQLTANDRLADRFNVAAMVVTLGIAAAVTFSLTFSVATNFEGAFQFAGAFVLAASLAITLKGAGALAVTFGGALTIADLLDLEGPGDFAVGLTTSLIVLWVIAYLIRSISAPLMSYMFYLVTLVLLLALAAALFPLSNLAKSFFLFWGIFPILNAVFDFASYGITRMLIRKGAEWRDFRTILLGVADLAIAGVMFALLSMALILTITFFNFVSVEPLIDLGATLVDISRHPDHYWWLYAMIFTTLIPTLLHFGLALFCWINLLGPDFRSRIADRIEMKETHGGAYAYGFAQLTGLATLAFALPLALFAGALWGLFQAAPDIGRGYLWFITRFANWLGEDIPKSVIMTCVNCA